jgi:hypothetical protein
MEPIEHRAKMQPRAEAPEGLETDGEGNVIPLDERLPEDQARAVGQGLEDKRLEDKRQEDHGVKNPDHEAENPASMPDGARRGSPLRPVNDDPAGQQAGTQGGGRDRSPPL